MRLLWFVISLSVLAGCAGGGNSPPPVQPSISLSIIDQENNFLKTCILSIEGLKCP